MAQLETEFKRQTPDEIIQDAINMGVESFYGLLSGGKDSMSVNHFIAKNYPKYFKGSVYTMTGVGLKQTRWFVKEQTTKHGWPLNFTWTKYNYIPDWIVQNGFGGQGVHNIVMGKLKAQTWRQFLREHLDEKPALISGVRKKESVRRSKRIAYKNPIDEDGEMIFVKPFFYKNGLQLWDYIGENNLEISPVHGVLDISGDCLCGCFANPQWELELIKKYYPYFYSAIKWGEKQIQLRGTPKAKKYPTWGSGPSVNDVDFQTDLKEFFGETVVDEYCTESCQVVV